MKPKKIYIVQRLNTEFSVRDVAGQKRSISVVGSGIAGYLPAYTNKKDAKRASEKGKYQIVIAEANSEGK